MRRRSCLTPAVLRVSVGPSHRRIQPVTLLLFSIGILEEGDDSDVLVNVNMAESDRMKAIAAEKRRMELGAAADLEDSLGLVSGVQLVAAASVTLLNSMLTVLPF